MFIYELLSYNVIFGRKETEIEGKEERVRFVSAA